MEGSSSALSKTRTRHLLRKPRHPGRTRQRTKRVWLLRNFPGTERQARLHLDWRLPNAQDWRDTLLGPTATVHAAGRPAPGTGAATGGRQHAGPPPAGPWLDAGAAPPEVTAVEVARQLRGADGPAADRGGARDFHPASEPGRDGHACSASRSEWGRSIGASTCGW